MFQYQRGRNAVGCWISHHLDNRNPGNCGPLARPTWQGPLGKAHLARPTWQGPLGKAHLARPTWQGPFGKAHILPYTQPVQLGIVIFKVNNESQMF